MESFENEHKTRNQILDLIVEKGPITSITLGKILKLTSAAIRRHITALEQAGMIKKYEPPNGAKKTRGRPSRYYVATENARDKMPKEYSNLANRALDYLSKIAGPEAISSFAASRSRELERKYAPIINAAGKDPVMRAHALADALSEDGYAATVRQVGDGTVAIQICQGNCPVQEVAGEFPQLCEAEAMAFSKLLNVNVQRLATLAGGDHVCTTHVPIGMPTLRKGATFNTTGNNTHKRGK
ncbi:MarR family transcriptional regulator [Actinomyces sp. zg-332]|uniref:helix-turn-helix transcriptional regulator n=1 Tax=Actinomyces sp. zg-332 TaxID=2708340 RepID=UPI00141ED6E2|nr:MarR family transcriptional regulator [Actinomyces sp. zg-332]QPK94582.1 MarR family transcriptional regulator [Actinomyces sp. zg-332]